MSLSFNYQLSEPGFGGIYEIKGKIESLSNHLNPINLRNHGSDKIYFVKAHSGEFRAETLPADMSGRNAVKGGSFDAGWEGGGRFRIYFSNPVRILS